MLRLTLRTLLAYLDDTLEPAQAKQIGEKLAESEVAQKLVERIREVTRRRRLTAPEIEAAEQAADDANVIAEYLDNALSADQVGKVEQLALEDDTLLAELAACHQILTLVLGEPARVPTPARVRMYRIVKGPESNPYRRPNNETPVAGVAAPSELENPDDEDPMTEMVGPGHVLRWVGVGVAAVLLVGAAWMAVPKGSNEPKRRAGEIEVTFNDRPTTDTAAKVHSKPANTGGTDPNGKPDGAKAPDPTKDPMMKETVAVKPPDMNDATHTEVGPPARLVDAGKKPMDPVVIKPKMKDPKLPAGLVPPIDPDRKQVAIFDSPAQMILVRKPESDKWERVSPERPRLAANEYWCAVPGMRPEVQFDGGVRIQMWGNVPEFLNIPFMETRVIPHPPGAGIDAELSLLTGRVFITSRKAGPAVVRVRVLDEVWDITLPDQQAEVAIDRIGYGPRGVLFDRADSAELPRTVAYLGVLKGRAAVQSGFKQFPNLAAPARLKWDNKGGALSAPPMRDPDDSAVPDRFIRTIPKVVDVTEAVGAMTRAILVANASIDTELASALQAKAERPMRRAVTAYYLQAVDNMTYLLQAAEDGAPQTRDAAVRALTHWVAQIPGREQELRDLLIEKKSYPPIMALNAIFLARGTTVDKLTPDITEQLFTYLEHEKLLVRELARLALTRLDPAAAKRSLYDAEQPTERRRAEIKKWQAAFGKDRGK